MRILGTIDLEILHLAVTVGGTLDSASIEHSPLKRLGVGRTLDALASLRDRGLIDLNPNGMFSMSTKAWNTLWTNDIPVWIRILRLLQIKSCSFNDIINILNIKHEILVDELAKLQKRQLVMASPQIRDKKPQKIYEIQQNGSEIVDSIEEAGFDNYQEYDKWEDAITDALDALKGATDTIKRLHSATDAEKEDLLEKVSRARVALFSAQGDRMTASRQK